MNRFVANIACEHEPENINLSRVSEPIRGDGFLRITLERHGRRPLCLEGRKILLASNRCLGLTCWSDITIYETRNGRFASSLTHHFPANIGSAWSDAWLNDDPKTLYNTICRHDPRVSIPAVCLSSDCFEHQSDRSLMEPLVGGFLRNAWICLFRAVFGTYKQ